MNDSRRTGLLRLKHLREVTEAKGEDMAEARGRFLALADPAARPRVVSAFNLFQTPEPVAARLAGLFDRFGRTLEPSAGLGRLYRAVRARDAACPIVLVDSSPACCGELYRATAGDEVARLVAGDFLAMDADRLGGRFDSAIMNPPFKQGADIRHIRHALGLLNPGGRLVTLCAAGPRQRAALQAQAASWEELPAGTFDGTRVVAALVTFDA